MLIFSLFTPIFFLSFFLTNFFHAASPSLSQSNSLFSSQRSGFHLTTKSVLAIFKQSNKDRLKAVTNGKNPTFFKLTNTKSSLFTWIYNDEGKMTVSLIGWWWLSSKMEDCGGGR
jgi:hypothetical protein